ncbi:transposase [Brevibacillus sp. 1238]|uniref:transposase n=1 Tax=Brevibacillus sp. 1238 TaxID=2940565 RepID=UPI0024735ED3|nr:transposase [Brevibacillus sp. 1238]MDH6353637.1 transposase-like protein [Brevibacillus sp. 1238]
MKKRVHRRFTYEFKWEVVKQYLDGMSRSEVSKKYGLTEKDIDRWSKQSRVWDLLQTSKNPMEKLRQLQRENQRLKRENRNLKKLMMTRFK